MPTHFYVKQVKTCSQCNGKRMVQHPAWTEYWKEHADQKIATTIEDDRIWFQDHGWYRGSCLDIRTDGLPDEEVYCSECEGEGEIVTMVNLSKALKAYEEMGKCAADIGDVPCTCGWH